MTDARFIFEKYVLRWHRPNGPPEPRVLKAMIKMRGDLFVDVGCNRKYYSGLLKENFGRVITIDPNPKWDADLKIALSDFSGSAPFYIGDNEGSADSLIRTPHIQGVDWVNDEKYVVAVKMFDELGLDADLVKIDVEGGELAVLDGMNSHLPKNVVVELHDERRRYQLLSRMANKGYLPKRIDQTHWMFKRVGEGRPR